MAKESADRYVPGAPPSGGTVEEVLAWALRELTRASIVINNISAGQVDTCYAAPDKPRTGWIRHADGTQWNPGNGRGFYGYTEGLGWTFLG